MIHMRNFNDFEIENFKVLANLGIRYTTFQTYWTSLDKYYFDAIAPIRAFLLEEGFHDYSIQEQGPKDYRDGYILTDSLRIPTTASLYRPKTKNGDPRLWFSKLNHYASPDDIFAMFHLDNALYVINVTKTNVAESYYSVDNNPIKEILSTLSSRGMEISKELLNKFIKLYDNGHWYESEVQSDTGIGRAVETLLGIKMNASRDPDYKGIELKSKRLQRNSAKNGLFSQIPDWENSKFKSGEEIPDDGEILEMLERKDEKAFNHVVEWQLMNLHERLSSKHKETFWVSVDNQFFDGKEFFKYSYIEHTRNPNVAEFDNLIMQQFISLELLLCRPSGRGDTWNFKIKDRAMPLLFPESLLYKLDPNSTPHRGPLPKSLTIHNK